MKLHISEVARDDEIGIVKKRIKMGDISITTPLKSTKATNQNHFSNYSERINEITRLLRPETIENFHGGEGHSARFEKEAKKDFVSGSLNIFIPLLQGNVLPDEEHAKTLAHVIYSSSDNLICLPPVKKSCYCANELTSGGKPSLKFREESMKNYIDFQRTVIKELKLKNSKEILGIIPFGIPPKFSNPLLAMYFEEGISGYVIDGNNSNLLNSESVLRGLLSKIGENADEKGSSLAQTYIHGINLGVNNFTADTVSADDFLSMFTYLDVVGTVSKSRYFPSKAAKGYPTQKQEPKRKVFVKSKYAYQLAEKLPDTVEYNAFKIPGQQATTAVKLHNEIEQFNEAGIISSKIGQEKMKNRLMSKNIPELTMKRIQKVFESVKIS